MVALPFLDAMAPALSAQTRRPFRFGAVYVPNGIFPGGWHQEKTGSDFEFKPIMLPLEPYRSHLVTISKMKAPDGNPTWAASTWERAAWLNGTGPITKQANYTVIQSKKTIDQHRGQGGGRYAAALAAGRHRRYGHVCRRLRWISLRLLQHGFLAR
jgi:hypothetical protein